MPPEAECGTHAPPGTPPAGLTGRNTERDTEMANITTNARDFGRTETLGFVAHVRKAFADYLLYRRTVAELDALSNRELADLGLSRFAIKRVAFESVYGA